MNTRMSTHMEPIGRCLRAAAIDPDLPWALAFLVAVIVAEGVTVLAAFWVALLARFLTDWLTHRLHLDRCQGCGHPSGDCEVGW